jgi:hypothetical protein
MHPILARATRLALYLAFWVVVGILLAAVLASQDELTVVQSLLTAVPLAAMYAFVCLSAWYVARSMPLGTGGGRVAVTVTTASLASAAAWALIARGWTRLLHWGGLLDVAATAGGVYALLFGFGVLLYLLSIAGSYLLVTFERSREAERRGLEVQVYARDAELRSLRAQIDPHFLFNSLHSISALTTADPPAARRMTVLLGDFLRESLAVGSEARIPLGQELRLAERFLEIERVRFGHRLAVEIEAGGAEACLVPPLLLQPIVENAVTHGVAHLIEGGTVRVAASMSPSLVRIAVDNPCDPDRPRRTGTGVGLSNARARLRALYGDEASMSAGEVDGVWRVEVALPAEPARSSSKHEATSDVRG